MLGLLGGTFDPVHIAHLRLAIEVRERMQMDTVRLIPAPRPRLRDTPQVDAQTRLRLLTCAIKGIAGLSVDDRELAADGPTRSVETLRSIRSDEGDRPLCLILGADAASRLDHWYQWQDLIGLAHLVIARRPGAQLPEQGPVAKLINEHAKSEITALASQSAGFVYICDIPALDISATVVRERLANGRSIEFLVPDEVRHILIKEKLYATRQ